MPTVAQVFADPKFRSLPLADQRSVIGSLDPNFGKFSDTDQVGMIQHMLAAPPVASPTQVKAPAAPTASPFSMPEMLPMTPKWQPQTPAAPLEPMAKPTDLLTRVGNLIPESAVPALAAANKYAVQPFEAAAKLGGDVGAAAFSAVLKSQPEAALLPARTNPILTGIAEGAGRVVGSTITDPRNWPFLGSGAVRPLLQKAMAVGFSGMMAHGTISAASNLIDNWAKMTPQQRAEGLTQTGLSGVMTMMAGAAASELSSPTPGGALPEVPGLAKKILHQETVAAPSTDLAPGENKLVSGTAQSAITESPSPAVAPNGAPMAAGDTAPERVQAAQDAARPPTPPTPAVEPTQGASTVEQSQPSTPPVSVKAFVTKSDESALAKLGYPQEIIDRLTPAHVQAITSKGYTYESLSARGDGQATPQVDQAPPQPPPPSTEKAPSAGPTVPVGKFTDIEKAIKFGEDTYGTGKYRINQVNGEQQVTPKDWIGDPKALTSDIKDRLDVTAQLRAKQISWSKDPEVNADKLDAVNRELNVHESALVDKLSTLGRTLPEKQVTSLFEQHLQDRVIPAAERVGEMKQLAANFRISERIKDKLRDPNLSYEERVFGRKLLGQTVENDSYTQLRYIPKGPPGSKGAKLGEQVTAKIAEAHGEIRELLANRGDLKPEVRARLESYLERPVVKTKTFSRPKDGTSTGFATPSIDTLRKSFGSGLRSKAGNSLAAGDRATLDNLNARIKALDPSDPARSALEEERRGLNTQLMLKFLDREATSRQMELDTQVARANALGRGIRRTADDTVTQTIDRVMKPLRDMADAAERDAARVGIKPAGFLESQKATTPAPVEDTIHEAVAAPEVSDEQKAQYEKNSTFLSETLPARQEAVRLLRKQAAEETNFLVQSKLNVQLEAALAAEHQALRQAAKIQAEPYADSKLTRYEKLESKILSSEVTSPKDKELALQKLRNEYPNEAIAAGKSSANQKTLDAIQSAYSKPSGKGLASERFPRQPNTTPESGMAGLPLLTSPITALSDAFMSARAFTAPRMELVDVAEGTLRAHTGELARSKEVLEHQAESYVKSWEQRSNADSVDFVSKMENGLPQATAQDQAVANWGRAVLDERRQAITALDIGVFEQASGQKMNAYLKKIAAETDPAVKASMMAKMTTVSRGFIENYFPHIWENPGAAKSFTELVGNILSKRPLQGSKTFLMAREHEFFADGIAKGLIPVTFNPIKQILLRVHEMDKFLMAWNIYKDAESRGMVTDDEDIGKAMGYVKLDPRTFSKATWAEPNQARILNNYLSPSLWNHSFGVNMGRFGHVDVPVYRYARTLNNVLNMAQLGLSGFHATGTAINTMVSDLGLAMMKASRGDLLGAVHPLVRSASIIGSPISAYIRGNELLAAYIAPDAMKQIGDLATTIDMQGSRITNITRPTVISDRMARGANMVEIAGGRARIDPTYKAIQSDTLQRNWKVALDDNYSTMQRMGAGIKGLASIPTTLLEKAASPIMADLVPKLKLGTFLNLAEETMARIGPDASPELTRMELGKAWDSIDNRFGQLVLDNAPWKRATKDLLQLGFRSIGWNLGDLREGLGAVKDTIGEVAKAATFRAPTLTPRMAYVIALPIQVGFLGMMLQYARTGIMPQNQMDYFFPKNGQKNAEGEDQRDNLPTYMRDYYAVKHDWQTTITNKLSPILQMSNELWRNRDFYNTEIAHPDDPLSQRITARMGYVLRSFAPFSFRNASDTRKAGGSLSETAQKFIGITPAPAWAGRSPMTERLSEMVGANHASVAGHTAQAFTEQQAVGNLRARLAHGTATGKDVMQAVKDGKISINEAVKLQETNGQSFVDRQFSSSNLNAAQALELYNLATPAEKAHILPFMYEKRANISPLNYAKPEMETLLARYHAAGIK